MTLRLHGVPLSQPFRSVAWGLLQNKVPFKVVVTVPGSTSKAGSKEPGFLAKSPLGTVPLIEEEATGFTLFESPAILSYLGETQGWAQWPASSTDRARVQSFMHWHHQGTRSLAAVFAPFVRPDMACTDEELDRRMLNASSTLKTLESVWLDGSPFLAGQSSATVADLLAYEEVVQLLPEYLNVGPEMAPFPKVLAWCDRMKALPCTRGVEPPRVRVRSARAPPSLVRLTETCLCTQTT